MEVHWPLKISTERLPFSIYHCLNYYLDCVFALLQKMKKKKASLKCIVENVIMSEHTYYGDHIYAVNK